MTKKCYAAIDLGTNSCRLLVCDENGNRLCKESAQVRLGEGLYSEKKIMPAAFERGLNCFYNFKQILDRYESVSLRAIATAGCRMASNSEDFLRQVYAEAMIPLEVIDGYEEARLNLKGALEHVRGQSRYVILYDLGGGSTEITLATNDENPQMIHTVSIPWGARNAAEAFGLENPDDEQRCRLAEEIRGYVDEFSRHVHLDDIRQDVLFLATSSTPLRLAALINKFEFYDRDRADGLKISRAQMDEQIEKICRTPQSELAKNPCVGESRSHIFIAGCAIFKTVYDCLQISELTTSLKSAVDGIVAEMIEKDRDGKVNEVSA